MVFDVVDSPTDDLLAAIERGAPHNPFNSSAYARALHAARYRVVALVVRNGDAIESGCLAVIEGRRISRTLRIPSLEVTPVAAPFFWKGLRDTCRRLRLLYLKIETFGSATAEIPDLSEHSSRRQRTEFMLELNRGGGDLDLSTNHKRRHSRARKLGVSVSRATSTEAFLLHYALQRESFARRRERGEAVPDSAENALERILLGSGGGELFQATLEGRVLSSIFLLRSPTAAYYHSAGTSEEGNDAGSSHFLIAETARALREEGVRFFNLGGAEPSNPGLYRFKDGFGGQPFTNDEVRFRVGSKWRAKVGTAMHLARHDRQGLLRALVSTERFNVFHADSESQHPALQAPLSLKRLNADDLRRHSESQDWVRGHLERAAREAPERIVGLYNDDELVHIAWVHTAATDRRLRSRTLRVREGEAEVTNCETAPAARGRGYYPIVIAELCRTLFAETDVRNIFMITSVSNTSSRHGIEKAGLRHAGRITRVRLPWIPSSPWFTYRRVRRRFSSAVAP